MTPSFFQITLKLFLMRENSLLVLKESQLGHGDLPGGRLHKGEIYNPLHRALEREIAEELGTRVEYSFEDSPLFLFPHTIRNGGHEALGIAFAGEYHGGAIDLSNEHEKFEWVDIESYRPEDHFSDHLLDAVKRFLSLRSLEVNGVNAQ